MPAALTPGCRTWSTHHPSLPVNEEAYARAKRAYYRGHFSCGEMSPYFKKGVLVLEEIRERLLDLIKMMPEDKLPVLLDFANRMYNEYQEGEESDDELLMT